MKKIKVISIVVNKATVVLYKEDGSEIIIKQGNIANSEIIVKAVADIDAHGSAKIILGESGPDKELAIYEEHTSVVKFFRVAKKFVRNLFGSVEESKSEPEVKVEESKKKHKKAVSAIVASAPETQTKRMDLDVFRDNKSTIVAVVDDTVIPDAEAIKAQANHANSLEHYKGLDAFMQRIAKVIHERHHSVEDLLKFLKRADLSIMDDGSILAYKRVKSTSDPKVFVDSHTGKVKQWVGCRVFMDPSMVDHNRRNECSHGLHVARRQYLSRFWGDCILFIKIAPEDVIAVPEYDSNKVRVSAYEILGQTNKQMFELLDRNRPLDTDEAKLVISNYLKGNHIGITDTVEIGGPKGTDLKYNKVSEQDEPKLKPVEVKQAPIKEKVIESETKGDTLSVKQVIKSKPKTKRTEKERMLQAASQPTVKQAKEILAWKRRQKKSWEKLGITAEQGKRIVELCK